MRKTVSTLILVTLLALGTAAQENPTSPILPPNEGLSRGLPPSEGMAKATRYEYAVVTDYYSTNTKKDTSYKQVEYGDGTAMDMTSLSRPQILNQLAAQGWELVSTDSFQNADSYAYREKTFLYLRRPRQ